MKLNQWLPFVFPADLRESTDWIDQFGGPRRTYLLGFASAAHKARRRNIPDVHRLSSLRFKDDPRRVIPFPGWRDQFGEDGEKWVEPQQYYDGSQEPKFEKCFWWSSYGKDQPEHAWLKRPMRLYEALKSIAIIEDAAHSGGLDLSLTASDDGIIHKPGELSLHIAVYTVGGFTRSYYEQHFANAPARLERLFTACQLRSTMDGESVPTFYEMAQGMSATQRTCNALVRFCADDGLPQLGSVVRDLAPRGTYRNSRRATKKQTRKGVFVAYSADCVIEIFWAH